MGGGVSEWGSEGVSESGAGFEGEWGIVRVADCPYIAFLRKMRYDWA
jgi:hypothetical protein